MLDSLTRKMLYSNNGITVTRIRNSSGYAAITMKIGKRMIVFSNDNDNYYEGDAQMLADLLNEAASNPCLLPDMDKKLDADKEG